MIYINIRSHCTVRACKIVGGRKFQVVQCMMYAHRQPRHVLASMCTSYYPAHTPAPCFLGIPRVPAKHMCQFIMSRRFRYTLSFTKKLDFSKSKAGKIPPYVYLCCMPYSNRTPPIIGVYITYNPL